MVNAVRTVVGLPDPVGQVVSGTVRPNGLLIEQVREPLGVVAVVYEARPNVTVDVAALCLKSGNAAVLRGSSIAAHTNGADRRRHRRGAAPARTRSRRTRSSSSADHSRDGGDRAADRRRVRRPARPARRAGPARRPFVSTRPCRSSSTATATATSTWTPPPTWRCDHGIVVNAKTSRPSVCNAAETLLVHAGDRGSLAARRARRTAQARRRGARRRAGPRDLARRRAGHRG